MVTYLTDHDAALVLDAAHELADIRGEARLKLAVSQRLVSLLNAEISAFTQINIHAATAHVALYPSNPQFEELPADTARTLSDNPIVGHWATNPSDRQPRRVSELISDAAWRRSSTYGEVLAPLGTPFMLGIPLKQAAYGGPSYAVARSGRDFTDHERDLAAALQVALVTLHGRYESWGPARPPVPLPRSQDGSEMLTPREAQVLVLLSHGASAQRIARDLRLSPRTVRKHLQHIYAKLGTHDRLSAVNRSRELDLL